MPRSKGPTFKSYIDNEKGRHLNAAEDDGTVESDDEEELKLLPGEVLICHAQHVQQFIPYSDFKQGQSGSLYCTNFKLSFIPIIAPPSEFRSKQRNKFMGDNEVSLNNIDAIYQVSKGKRRKLMPSTGVSGHVKKLEIHCKDFRILAFSLKDSAKQEAKQMVNTVVHHAFPTRLELLFAFEYAGTSSDKGATESQTCRYRKVEDWNARLEQTGADLFRATLSNPDFRLSSSMPECFVVPKSLTDADVAEAIPQFLDYRCPTWCYSFRNGASLFRMSYLRPETTQVFVEKKMMDAMRSTHPRYTPPQVFDLGRILPTPKDVQASYEKFRELCMPVSMKEVWETDSTWYSSVENTRWPSVIAVCLSTAYRAMEIMIRSAEHVILKEQDGRDFVAVISCLVQLFLDPSTRTIQGFQSLIEREWVAMGHRFTDRCGLLSTSDTTEQSPVFLVFLECTWQLLQQFPSAFEFSEIYLTSLWDSVCLGLFENFIFNNDRERMMATKRFSVYATSNTTPNLMSVWEWSKQFSEDDMSLCNNPLYLTRYRLKKPLSKIGAELGQSAASQETWSKEKENGIDVGTNHKLYAKKLSSMHETEPSIDANNDFLRPVVSAALLKFWGHCYLRWLTPVQIIAGGTPLEYLTQCILVEEILCLQHKVESLQNSTPFNKADRRRSALIFGTDSPSSAQTAINAATTPRSKRELLTSSFPYTPGQLPSHVSFLGTPISLFVEGSILANEDSESEEDDV